MIDFPTLIRKARIDKGFSQDYVSTELGITLSAYSKIERGLTDPSLSRMKQIAEVLEVDLGLLFKPKEYPYVTEVSEPNGSMSPVSRYEFEACLGAIHDLQEQVRYLSERIV